MAYRGSHHSSPFVKGAIVGVIAAFLLQFRIVQILVLGAIAYFCALFLYDALFTQSVADPSTYSMRVADEVVPDFHFSRQNPEFTVTTEMTNNGDVAIRKWTLYGTLYECPRAFVPLDMCQKIGRSGTWVTDAVAPGETVTTTTVFNFWDNDDTTGQLRVVWSAETVIVDTDTDQPEWQAKQRADYEAQSAY